MPEGGFQISFRRDHLAAAGQEGFGDKTGNRGRKDVNNAFNFISIGLARIFSLPLEPAPVSISRRNHVNPGFSLSLAAFSHEFIGADVNH